MSRSVSEKLSSAILRIVFRHTFWQLWVNFWCHFNAKTLFFKFLWLEFRFNSFLELHVHFKGFVCLRMRKLHTECQIPADMHDWCQICFRWKFQNSFQNIERQKKFALFWMIGQNFDPVYKTGHWLTRQSPARSFSTLKTSSSKNIVSYVSELASWLMSLHRKHYWATSWKIPFLPYASAQSGQHLCCSLPR